MSEGDALSPAYVSAGSSIEPQKNLLAALGLLQAQVRVSAVSTVYRTPALGRPEDPDFLNCVFEIQTTLPPRALRSKVLRPAEDSLRRERTDDKWGPRTCDLDLILYGSMVSAEEGLRLPHPDVTRWFVRVPLVELAPELELPGTGERLADLADAEGGAEAGEPLPDFTELLRGKLKP